jgi:hypothetical protein
MPLSPRPACPPALLRHQPLHRHHHHYRWRYSGRRESHAASSYTTVTTPAGPPAVNRAAGATRGVAAFSCGPAVARSRAAAVRGASIGATVGV